MTDKEGGFNLTDRHLPQLPVRILKVGNSLGVPANFETFDFIESKHDRELVPEENVALWERAFARAGLDDDRRKPVRCFLAWRTSRWILQRQGRISLAERLIDLELNLPEAFYAPAEGFIHRGGNEYYLFVQETFEKLPISPHSHGLSSKQRDAIVEGHVALAHMLKIPRGAKENPFIGVDALNGLNADNFPSPDSLVAFEEGLLEALSDRMRETSRSKALMWLRDQFGLTNHEVVATMKLVDRMIVDISRQSKQEMRANMVVGLERLLDSAIENFDGKLELSTRRLLAKVQGIDGASLDEQLDLRLLASSEIKPAEFTQIEEEQDDDENE